MAQKTKRITIYDVANEAHVSLSTVSRVLNGIDKVSPDTKAAVDKAIIKLGFVPSSLARGLAKKTTTNVAIVLPSPNYSYISSLMSGMLDVCKIYGYIPTLFTYEDPEDAAVVVENVIASHVEGIVIFNSELSAADLHKMVKIKLPMVLIGRDNYGNNSLVDMDYSSTLNEVISRYINRDIKRIVYLKDPLKDWHMVSTFENSIKDAIGDKNISFETLSLSDSYNTTYNYFYEEFKKNKPSHQLYIAIRDSLSAAIVNAACDLGYKVPDDLEVIGVIGTKNSIMNRPTISSIDVDLYEIGSISMRMLTKMLNNTLKDKFYQFKTEFVKRDSTKD